MTVTRCLIIRPINVCHLLALSTVLAILTVITSATSRTPLLTKEVYDLEVKQEQLPLLSDRTLGPRQLAKRIDINNLVSKELGQGVRIFAVGVACLDKILSLETCLR